jgi:hypothetical protein
MFGLIMAAAFVAQEPPAPRRPAALLLEAKGKVAVRPVGGEPQPIGIGELLFVGERLAVPADGAATLAILVVGAREDVKPGSEVTIGRDGCAPPEAIVRRQAEKRSVAQGLRNLRPARDDSRQAGVNLRAQAAIPPAIRPCDASTVAGDRPDLAWPAAPGATSYRVRMSSGGGRELWRAEVKEPRLAFPEGQAALARGFVYRWEVTDERYRPVTSGEFSVASESERARMEELAALARSGDPADRFAAGLALERMGAVAEALEIYRGLIRDQADEPAYRRASSRLRHLAGQPERE